MLFLVFIVFAFAALINVPGLIRDKRWKDLYVYSGIFVIALTLSTLMAVGVEIPSPIKSIEYLLEKVVHLTYAST